MQSYMFQRKFKIDIYKSECIESCKDNEKEYYICYDHCPNYTYTIEKDSKICYDKEPDGYYLDLIENKYKKCFQSCKYCCGSGNETNHNFKKCRDGFIYINDSVSTNNCYIKCKNY